jgi:hypothetical protein
MKEKDNIALSFHWWLVLMIRTFTSITKKKEEQNDLSAFSIKMAMFGKVLFRFCKFSFFEYFPFSISSMYGRIPNKKPNVMRLWNYY